MSRPPTKIDWATVDKYLIGGADGVQIARMLGIHPETFYRRCEKENNVGFTEYAQGKRSHGDAMIHLAQFNKAMKGDSQMLKHLGEHRLGQKSAHFKDLKDASREGVIEAVREIERINAGISEIGRSPMEIKQSLLDKGCPRQAYPVSNELGAEGAI